MKIIVATIFLAALGSVVCAQKKETYDLTTYIPPKTWKKQSAESGVQFIKQDLTKGTYCMITLYKAIPGKINSKENFDLAWESLVKEMVSVSAAPEMQPVSAKNGWEVQSGYAAFENEGNKGAIILVTASAFEKMMNIVILTNTDVYEKNITDFLRSVSLKKAAGATQIIETAKDPVKLQPAGTTTKQDGFAFTSTNFDNGWTSTIQEDWVTVTKNNTVVLLHFPIALTDEIRMDEINVCWNLLAAKRYEVQQFYRFNYSVLNDFQYYFLQADATDKSTGKKVFVSFQVVPKNGVASCYEIVSPSKTEFQQQFPAMDNIAGMGSYNKFAVAASDLKGKWTNNFTGMLQYVNVYTGADAGMSTNSSSEIFEFSGSSYNWELKVASGFVGNIKFQDVKSSGKYASLKSKIRPGLIMFISPSLKVQDYCGWRIQARGDTTVLVKLNKAILIQLK
jgi:hypothetical protein